MNGSLTNALINLSPKLPTTRMGMIRNELKKYWHMTVLDLACGDGNSTRMVIDGMADRFLLEGIDAYPKSLSKAARSGLYRKTILGDIRNCEYPLPHYDIVMLCEVLEHLTKEDGHALLDRLDGVATHTIIITTPAYSDLDPNVKRDEPIEERIRKGEFWRVPHISIWSKEEYEQHGYTVKGANGLHIPRLPYALGVMLGMMLSPIVLKYPDKANHLVAVKRF